jgi:hypothetical protein
VSVGEREREEKKQQREHQQNDHSKTSSSWDELGLSAGGKEKRRGIPSSDSGRVRRHGVYPSQVKTQSMEEEGRGATAAAASDATPPPL